MSLSLLRYALSSEAYSRWCAETQSLYVQPWWLRASTGCEDMPVLGVALNKEEQEALSLWPLFMPTSRHLIVPPYCQSAGPMSSLPGAVGRSPFDRDRYITHLGVMETLSKALPPSLRYIEAHLPINFLDWLPCDTSAGVWHSSVAYTHLLPLTETACSERYNVLIRRKIRRASTLGLHALWSDTSNVERCVDMLTQLSHRSLQRSGGERLCASSLRRLIQVAIARRQGVVHILCSQHTGRPVAGAFVVHHRGTAYYIAGGQERDQEGQDAMALLLDNLIGWCREMRCHTFDFEGSMHRGIAFFFRSFGSVPHPYLRLRAGRQTLSMRLRLHRYYLKQLY